ncbi:MAG: GGDEF domain-containing protein [Candidatus Nanoarchaeia archaeon]|nr:GGDEF domain-containing protein [Candidatus Nanoarchaeia archaeon]
MTDDPIVNSVFPELLVLRDSRLEKILQTKPEGMSIEQFYEVILKDLLYKETARDHLISPEKTIIGRVTNTLKTIKSYDNFSNLQLQVYLNEGGNEILLASEPNGLKDKLDGDNLMSFPLDNLGNLVIKSKGILPPYEELLLKSFANTLRLHIENASEYEKNQRAAMLDGLTGLYNGAAFKDSLEREISSELETSTKGLALIMLDLDNFKSYNDLISYTAGDDVLKEVAYLLKKVFTRKRDLICRSGIGDEFAIIMPRTRLENAIDKAESIRNTIYNTYFKGEETAGKITVSGGVSHTCYGFTSENLLESTIKALHKAKDSKNKIVQYKPEYK